LNSKKLYALLKSCKSATFPETLAGMTKKDIIPLYEEQKIVLRDILPGETVAFKPVYKSIKECSP